MSKRIRLACSGCDTDEGDGINSIPSTWKDVTEVQSLAESERWFLRTTRRDPHSTGTHTSDSVRIVRSRKTHHALPDALARTNRCERRDERLGRRWPSVWAVSILPQTYNCDIKFSHEEGHVLNIVDDLVYYDGIYYGDWSIFDQPDEEQLSRLIPFDPQKAIPLAETD